MAFIHKNPKEFRFETLPFITLDISLLTIPGVEVLLYNEHINGLAMKANTNHSLCDPEQDNLL